MIIITSVFFKKIASYFPGLKDNLKSARMPERADEFVRRIFLVSSYATLGFSISGFLLFSKFELLSYSLLILPILIFAVSFFYLLKLPDVKIRKTEKEINKEIVFAGRHLIIEIGSGVPLYNAMLNMIKNYEVIGRHFKEITDKVDLGTSMEDALNEAVELIPSKNFKRILWQILNSLRTGSEISKSLAIVLEQIVREQQIEVNEYGRKLNPLAMFYMIIAVILPTLGTTMLVVLSSFIEFELNLTILLVIAFFLGFVQFMFLSIIKFSRPAIEF